jgi:hypothetical protein
VGLEKGQFLLTSHPAVAVIRNRFPIDNLSNRVAPLTLCDQSVSKSKKKRSGKEDREGNIPGEIGRNDMTDERVYTVVRPVVLD